MNSLTPQELKTLIEYANSPCVSLTMPCVQGGSEAFQNPTRLKDLLRDAEQQLCARVGAASAEDWIKPVHRLVAEETFWQHPGAGLALFFAPNFLRVYPLPMHLHETVTVGERFYLKPLLPLLNDEAHFYVLALSQNAVRLYSGTRDALEEVPLPGVPTSLKDSLRYDDIERQLQQHSGGVGHSALFYGHSIDREDEKNQLRAFFRQVDQGLPTTLRESHAPLLLAGAEYLFPLYAEASAYPALLSHGIPGNPEHMSLKTLHERAFALVEPLFHKPQQQDMEEYAAKLGTGLASNDVAEIVPAAYGGRVRALLVVEEIPQWGRFDTSTNKVLWHAEPCAGDEDLTNLAVIETLKHGGSVYTAPPEALTQERPLGAVMRF